MSSLTNSLALWTSWARRLSEPARTLRTVLDTDVVFSRVLHELLGRIATELRMLTLIWSNELINEIERVLIERKPISPEAARRWAGYLRDAFPDERVDVARLPEGIDLAQLTRDRGDEHVCALAIAGRADLLLTMDHGYLAPGLQEHGIEVRKPDEFLMDVLAEEPAAVLGVLRAQAAVWGGGLPLEALFGALDRAQATGLAAQARAMLAS